MNEPNERMDGMVDRVRSTYHVPGEVPREEMWRAVSAGIAEIRASRTEAPPGDLARARARRALARHPAWLAVAAAALVVLGIGIGRSTAPAPDVAAGPQDLDAVTRVATGADRADALDLAAREHLGRTESLLTAVRVDARNGSIDPGTADWARGLLVQTRLLIDAGRGGDAMMGALLEDLELLLIQIVGLSEAGSQQAEGRVRTELELALRSLEQGEVLGRIQAVLPTMEGA